MLRSSSLATVLFVLLLVLGVSRSARAEGNVSGEFEAPIVDRIAEVQTRIEDLATALDLLLAGPGGLSDVDITGIRGTIRDLDEFIRDDVLERLRLVDPASFQDSTNAAAAIKALSDLAFDLRGHLQLLGFTSDPVKLRKAVERLQDDVTTFRTGAVRAGLAMLGLAPNSRGKPSPDTFVADDGGVEAKVDFESKGQRRPEKGMHWRPDLQEARSKVRRLRSEVLHKDGATKKGARNVGVSRVLTFRPKTKRTQDAFGFLDMNRDLRGPFVWSFTAGVFTDDPDPALHRGNAFIGMELSALGATPDDTFSVNVRYTAPEDAQAGVQVFAASPGGFHGNLFLPGEQLVDVKVEYDGSAFDVFVKPFGAPDNVFLQVGTYAHGGQDVVWHAGVGVNNLSGRTELGIDDISFRDIGDGGSGGGGGGGGDPAPAAYAASYLVDGTPVVSGGGTLRFFQSTGTLTIELLAGGKTVRLTLKQVSGTGVYDPDPTVSHYQEIRGIAFTYRFQQGSGQVNVTHFDPVARTFRATFEFTGKDDPPSADTRTVTSGAVETDKLIVFP